MNSYSSVLQKVFTGLFIGTLAVFLYGYFMGYELSIPWNVTTTADSNQIGVHTFQKGPFSFEFLGTSYELAENFSAGAIQNDATRNAFFLGIVFLGICILLAISTYLSRIWFIGMAGLFIFLIINLRLQDIGFLGFGERSSMSTILILGAFLIPTYLFHAFYTHAHFLIRLGALVLITTLLVLFGQVDLVVLQGQLITGSYFGLVILSLLFLLIVAEENVFGILYLITNSKGGKNNHIHFSIFSFIYLSFLGLYYGKKSGLLNLELTYFDPFILLAISSLVTLWSLKYKGEVFKNILDTEKLRIAFTGLGITVFGFLGMAFFRGNDSVYEGLHYFIIYCHLGFGVMFFFYLLLNFVNPLSKGLQVYKVAYKEQNFPYISAKLGGIAAVAAFFFLASREPFLLFRAGHYNYLGAQVEETGNVPLAQEYYQEGAIYGYDNHFPNYKMAYYLLGRQDIDEASYRFQRATLRYPSPHSFINHSGTLAIEGETTPSMVTLKNGLRQFPGNSQLLNNLGLIYLDLGDDQQALQYLSQSASQGSWTNANLVNLWKIIPEPGTTKTQDDYLSGNLAVKANILHRQLTFSKQVALPFDSTYLYPSYPMHRLAYLINATWYFPNKDFSGFVDQVARTPVDENMLQSAKHAMSTSRYLNGEVNDALLSHDVLRTESRADFQKDYLHELGLMALEQHALPNALEFFEEAIGYGSEKSLLAKTAVLLELGRLDAALDWSKEMLKRDSSYNRLVLDLQKLDDGANLSTADQLTRLYYFYDEYSLPELSVQVSNADTSFLRSLWKKMEYELLLTNEYTRLLDYQEVLKPYVNRSIFEEFNVLRSLNDGGVPESNHPLSKALRIDSDSLKAVELAQIASKNAFNVPLILAAITELNKLDVEKAYDVLVQAYNLNPHSPQLIKAYVEQCLQLNLVDYATTPLDRLAELVGDEEYFRFVNYVNERLEQIRANEFW